MLIAFMIGIGMGSFFFGGLYVTTRWMLTAQHPGLLMWISMLLRFAWILVGLYWLAQDGWPAMLIALAGMMIVRTGMSRFLGGKRYEY